MDVGQLTQSPTTPVSNGSTQSSLSSDFETFLKMLTVQMENQDPLNPIESADYAVQLATFSSVEQQVQTNDLLKELMAQNTTSALGNLGTWVGQEVRATTAAYFDGSPVTISPEFDASADRFELVVQDATGEEVQRLSLDRTEDTLDWAGVESGEPMASGLYSFTVVGYSGEDVISTKQAQVYATVSEVQINDGMAILNLKGGGSVAAADVTALRDPEFF